MTPTEAVASRVRQLRRTRGWTAEELADRMTEVGIPWNQPVVSRLETGKRESISLAEVLALAYILDVAPIHLFVPIDPGEAEYQVVPSREIAVHAAREWIRGQAPLPGGDVRQYFSEVPVEEYAAASAAYMERLRRRVQGGPGPEGDYEPSTPWDRQAEQELRDQIGERGGDDAA